MSNITFLTKSKHKIFSPNRQFSSKKPKAYNYIQGESIKRHVMLAGTNLLQIKHKIQEMFFEYTLTELATSCTRARLFLTTYNYMVIVVGFS